MGEETSNSTQNKTRTKTTRPKAVYLWTVSDVQKWYRRHCGEYTQYEQLLPSTTLREELLRITDSSLQRMGVSDNRDREAIWREIVKQRLKTDIMEIRDMETQHTFVIIDLQA
ncbi:protein aveugle-like [Drosophila serrata]|uniref:protein aveugle-like n=1 Tax=Drosophila serrata TaxID=7274 RepID=UPI000A1D01E5|nr:protein aveugle-like [Drosophila serrata]